MLYVKSCIWRTTIGYVSGRVWHGWHDGTTAWVQQAEKTNMAETHTANGGTGFYVICLLGYHSTHERFVMPIVGPLLEYLAFMCGCETLKGHPAVSNYPPVILLSLASV